MLPGIVARKIDELLRTPTSSIYEIISDDEAISEFRSGNQKMIARLTSAEGVDTLINLVTIQNLPDGLSANQKMHLPFVATELIACEVDDLLDAFTRVVPGQRNGLDRLFDFLIIGDDSDPTVLGYVVRVLLVLINRRVLLVDQYLGEHLQAIQEGLLDLISDRSVADLVFRLALDEGTKSFKLDYVKLASKLNVENAVCILWFIDSLFGKPLLGNNEQVVANFNYLMEDVTNRGGLSVLLDEKCFGDDPIISASAFNIIAVLIQYCFTRPVSTESGLSEPPVAGWETTFASPSGTTRISIDEDSCVFDDEMNSPAAIIQPTTPYTQFGALLISKSIEILNDRGQTFFQTQCLGDIMNLLAFLRFVARCSQYQSTVSPRLSPALVAHLCTESFKRYPKSSAIHNMCRDCIMNITDLAELNEIATVFVPFVTEDPERIKGHTMRILHYLDSKLTSSAVSALADPANAELVRAAVKRWAEIDTRLVDRQDKIPTRSPSPHGVTPIIDLEVSDQWVAMDFGSPQVRFHTDQEEEGEKGNSSDDGSSI